MKRGKMAIALTIAMLGTSIPMGAMATCAEEMQDGFVSVEVADTEDAYTILQDTIF